MHVLSALSLVVEKLLGVGHVSSVFCQAALGHDAQPLLLLLSKQPRHAVSAPKPVGEYDSIGLILLMSSIRSQ